MDAAAGTDAGVGRGGAVEVVEFSTHVRGCRLVCRWDGEQLTGDLALLERLRRNGGLPAPGDRPGAVARAIRAAVPAPVSIAVTTSDPSAPARSKGTFVPARSERTPPTMVG